MDKCYNILNNNWNEIKKVNKTIGTAHMNVSVAIILGK